MMIRSESKKNRYQFITPCGVGGYGNVFLYKDLHLDRSVAVKTFRTDISGAKSRLDDEVSSLLKMRSNHVVQVYDVITNFDQSGSLGLVMEYIEGRNILLPSNKQDFLKLLWQIASGITDIHQEGLIHRDIKLDNMMIDKEGIVKIFDFGLTKMSSGEAYSHNLLGTPGYAAPELYDSSNTFTSAIDVYAFCYLVAKLLNNIQDYVVTFKHEYLNDYSELEELLLQGLSEIPCNRPKMIQFKELLEKYLLRERHRATLIYGNRIYRVSSDNPRIILNFEGLGSCTIEYDNFNFFMKNISGIIYVNNNQMHEDGILSGSCVISLGAKQDRNRTHLPFNTSNPEVVI